MSLLDSVVQNVGAQALDKIGARLGLPPATVQQAAQVILPALAGGLVHHAQADALPTPPASGAPPGSDEAQTHGNEVLGKVLGSKDASRALANEASAQTGINVDTLKKLLPQLASVAAEATSHAKTSGGLGGLVSNLGGML